MANELYWLLMLGINFSAIMIAFRLWGQVGLFIWMPISAIVANIQVTKLVVLFGLEATLGNIVYATSFLATDILSECYGKREAAKAVGIGFFSLVFMTICMQVAILFHPSEFDIAHESMAVIFAFMPRIAVASLTAYVLSQIHDIYAFAFWKRIRPGKRWLWLRNNASTMVSQLIDTAVFTSLAFWGLYSWPILWQIMVSTYLLKWVVALCDTPFLYLARHWYDSDKR